MRHGRRPIVAIEPFSEETEGTRFLLYPQAPFLERYAVPEVVQVSSPAGTVGPGPENDRMYAIHPVGKSKPYGISPVPTGGMYLPPWDGEILPPAMPDADGHFDHLDPSDPAFEMAHLFGAAHFTMDVWEDYFGHPIPWHFGKDGEEKLELTILHSLDNALIGWGFLEAGGTSEHDDEFRPYALNFDVVAHEVGHAIIYSQVGIPSPDAFSGEYFGFHESAADLVALITSLHFGSVIDDVMEHTRGNLYTLNRLSRFAELSSNRQIRLAANNVTLAAFEDGWDSEHKLSQPLTGAMFDILVDVFHERLLARDLITPEMEDLSDRLENMPVYGDVMQALFDQRYAENPEGFRLALIEARDFLGTYLAQAWRILDPDMLSYLGVGQALELVDREITGGAFLRIIRGNFRMREIGLIELGPRLSPPDKHSHSASVRTMVPE